MTERDEWNAMVERVRAAEAEMRKNETKAMLARLEWQARLVLSENTTAPCSVNPETLLKVVEYVRELEQQLGGDKEAE